MCTLGRSTTLTLEGSRESVGAGKVEGSTPRAAERFATRAVRAGMARVRRLAGEACHRDTRRCPIATTLVSLVLPRVRPRMLNTRSMVWGEG